MNMLSTGTVACDCGDVLYNINGMGWPIVSRQLSRQNPGELLRGFESDKHFFYGQRVIDIGDDLPKYLRGTSGPLFGQPDE